jgi:hypothetical protein
MPRRGPHSSPGGQQVPVQRRLKSLLQSKEPPLVAVLRLFLSPCERGWLNRDDRQRLASAGTLVAINQWRPGPFRLCHNFLVCRLRESDRSMGHVKTPLTYKAMAEAIWDEDNRKIEGASQMGCRAIEVHPTLTATGATRKHSKTPTTHPNLMFHYRVFGCLDGVFAAGGCYNLLQSVANCCESPARG